MVSSIGVNGWITPNAPFSERDTPAPAAFYAVTKLEAEHTLQRICAVTSMQSVIIRPTLVAGATAPGNLARLTSLVRKGIPLPVAGIHNRRTLIGVRSLAGLLTLSCFHPAAAGRLFVAAEERSLTTAQIVRHIAVGLGVRPRLFSAPTSLLKLAGVVTGRSREVMQLCGSLEVDASLVRNTLGWQPSVPIEAELEALGAAAR